LIFLTFFLISRDGTYLRLSVHWLQRNRCFFVSEPWFLMR
jgi:hypothetical protein